jgi:hypothetical protein
MISEAKTLPPSRPQEGEHLIGGRVSRAGLALQASKGQAPKSERNHVKFSGTGGTAQTL